MNADELAVATFNRPVRTVAGRIDYNTVQSLEHSTASLMFFRRALEREIRVIRHLAKTKNTSQ
jgi:hypothetical protein